MQTPTNSYKILDSNTTGELNVSQFIQSDQPNILYKASSMDGLVEGLQAAFVKLKAGIDTFGDDLQKVRSQIVLNQGADSCPVVQFIPLLVPVLIYMHLSIGIQSGHEQEESSTKLSVEDDRSGEYNMYNMYEITEKHSHHICKSGAWVMFRLTFRS